MKFEEGEDSCVLMKSCVNVLARSCVDGRPRLEFYHRQADGRNGNGQTDGSGGGEADVDVGMTLKSF